MSRRELRRANWARWMSHCSSRAEALARRRAAHSSDEDLGRMMRSRVPHVRAIANAEAESRHRVVWGMDDDSWV